MTVAETARHGSRNLPARIGVAEFRTRQDRARELAAAAGLAGLIVWSRGDSTQDRYAEVYYLANYYPHYAFVPDQEGRWRARGHGAFLLPVDGPATLVVDVAAFRDDLAAADEVVTTRDVVSAAAEATQRLMPTGQIGILGGETLCFRWYSALADALDSRLVDAEDIGPQLRLIKSAAELELLRAAGALGAAAVDALMDAGVPGASEADVVAAAVETIIAGGGMLYGMGISSGCYAHAYSQSQPAPFDPRYILRPGDMLRVDIYGSIDGYLFDFGRARVVGREPNDEQQLVIDAARTSVLAGIEEVQPGRTLGDVARRCEKVFAESEYVSRGLGLPDAFGSWGHSVSLAFDPPFIDADSDVVIEEGMCLAIEKRVAVPGLGGATYEDNVIVTERGSEVITPARRGYGGDSAAEHKQPVQEQAASR
jgi:Xaa-Pro aminopeptidase